MSHHLVTVCMFCLLCATHSTCGAHINRLTDDIDARYTIVKFDQETSERSLPFDLENNFREFDQKEETLSPYHVEELKDHGIKKKNLSDEKKMRYLQKLSKIRMHRKVEETPSGGEILEITHVSDDSLSGKDHGVDTIDRDSATHPGHSELADPSGIDTVVVVKSDTTDMDIHVPVSENSDRLSELEVKKRTIRDVSLRNVDPSVYVAQIFTLFGDAGSMTMNVTGFNEMLKHLNLEKLKEGGPLDNQVPDYIYNSGHEKKPNHTCVSSAELISTVNTRLNRNHRSHEDHQHDEVIVTEESLKAICPILLYLELAENSDEKLGCVIDNPFTSKLTAADPTSVAHTKRSEELSDDKLTTVIPGSSNSRRDDHHFHGKMTTVEHSSAYSTRRMEVWVYSSLSIFAISACGLLGVAVVPIMHKNYYNHIMQFLIALAIGTLGGDAFLHLIPHALSAGHSHGSHEDAESSHNDGMWKGLAAMMGVVFFYFIEKGLTVIAEVRKRHQKLDKENKLPSRVRVMKEGASSSKAISNSSTSSFLRIFNSKCKKEEDPDTKSCKHKYSEYPYCYDEISTDTHDHHHHRDGQIPPSPKSSKKRNNSVSVVSSNNLADKESEPSAKDWLLYKDEGENGAKTTGDFSQKDGAEMNNINHKEGDSKELKGEESYTVILREHSRAHHGHSHSHGHVHAPPSSLSSVVWMVIMGDGLHNFTDGMAIGAAFASNIAVGFSTAIAVLCHELPHELGDFAVLLKAGMSVRRAIFYNVLSSVLCVAGMVCGVLVGHAPAATSWVFAVAAGLFIYIALADLVPELSSSHSKEGTLCQCMLQLLGLCTGIAIMLLIALYEHDLETMFG